MQESFARNLGSDARVRAFREPSCYDRSLIAVSGFILNVNYRYISEFSLACLKN